MSGRKKGLLALLLTSGGLFVFAKFFLKPLPSELKPGQVISESVSLPVSVSSKVPSFYTLNLSGWTSPEALVEFKMKGLVRAVKASKEGRFSFTLSLPRDLGHSCLVAADVAGAASSPLCLPPPPPHTEIVIKEVVMPPTLKIDKGKILKGETVAAQGYTTPHSLVVPYAFEPKHWRRFGVLAAEVPKPQVKSDQKGFYQFNLPTSELGEKRLFVGSIFASNPSPKSTTLTFEVLSFWRLLLFLFINFLGVLILKFFAFLKTLKGIILVELVILGIIIWFFLKRKTPLGSKN